MASIDWNNLHFMVNISENSFRFLIAYFNLQKHTQINKFFNFNAFFNAFFVFRLSLWFSNDLSAPNGEWVSPNKKFDEVPRDGEWT